MAGSIVPPSIGPPTGAAAGDLGGDYPDPEVTGLLGEPLPATSANALLARNASDNGWVMDASTTFVPSTRTVNGHALSSNVTLTASDVGAQPHTTNLDTYSGITPSANIQTFLAAADYAAMRTDLGLVIGTNVQAYSANLTTYAGIAPSANVQTLLGAADYGAFKTDLAIQYFSTNGLTTARIFTMPDNSVTIPALAGDFGGTALSPTVTGLGGSALPANVSQGFLKRNFANNAWEEVAYGTGANTVCQGNDGRLLSGVSAFRKVGAGTGVNVPAASTVTLATFTRNANELLCPYMWVQENVAAISFSQETAIAGADGVAFFFQRTANPNEYTLKATNQNATTARTVDWAITGLVP